MQETLHLTSKQPPEIGKTYVYKFEPGSLVVWRGRLAKVNRGVVGKYRITIATTGEDIEATIPENELTPAEVDSSQTNLV